MGILIFFSFYKLTESPPLWYDEGIYTQAAMNGLGAPLLQVAPDELVSTASMTVGYPLLLPVGISYRLFGVGVLQGRAVMALFLLALGLSAYLLLHKLYGARTALFALLLLASFPMLYGNGKTVIGEIPGLFFLLACLFSLSCLEHTHYRDWRWYVTTGLTAGLAAAAKPVFILFLAALGLTYALRSRRVSLSPRGVCVGVVALALPLLMWGYLQFGGGVSARSVLSMYANPSGVGQVLTLVQQNAMRFVSEITPIYTAVLMLLWGAALYLRGRAGTSSAELAAFLFCVLVILAYLRIEGWYRHLFPATLVALLFLPPSCATLFERFCRMLPRAASAAWLPSAFILALAGGELHQTARSSFVADYYNSTRTSESVAALEAIPHDSSVFLYNAPVAAALLPSKNYYQYLSLSSQASVGEEQLPLLLRGVPDVVIVGSDFYQKDAALFTHYKVERTVNQYHLLTKK